MKHRKEEDDLYRKFARQREEEDKRMREEFRVSAVLYNDLIGSDTLYWRTVTCRIVGKLSDLPDFYYS